MNLAKIAGNVLIIGSIASSLYLAGCSSKNPERPYKTKCPGNLPEQKVECYPPEKSPGDGRKPHTGEGIRFYLPNHSI